MNLENDVEIRFFPRTTCTKDRGVVVAYKCRVLVAWNLLADDNFYSI